MTETTQINNLLCCSFCKKSNDKVGYLIVGPDDNLICDLCIEQFCQYLDNPAYVGIQDETVHCTFCTQSRTEVGSIIPASDLEIEGIALPHIANLCICDRCIDTCCEILQEMQEIN